MGTRPLRSGWLISPLLPAWQRQRVEDLRERCPRERDLIWILSSGTQSIDQVKAIGLGWDAIEASARSVNRFLKVTAADRWLVTLPTYHIAGYAILVRARLSRSRVFHLKKWTAAHFMTLVKDKKISLSSLVPAQVHDLVTAGYLSPACLRALIVGGGALAPDLYFRARALGWPVLPSYGLTECASQVATSSLKSLQGDEYPALEILPHVRLKTIAGRVWIHAESVCRYVATMSVDRQFTMEDPRRGGWLPTEDLGEVRGNDFVPLGRRDDVVKILGVLVHLAQVEADLCACAGEELTGSIGVIGMSSARAGVDLVAVTDSSVPLTKWESVVDDYNRKAHGPARIKKLCWVHELPRTSLGKLKRQELRRTLNLG